MILASGVKEDARKLLAVLAGKEGVQEGRPVPAGPEDAAAAGFGRGRRANGCTGPCGTS